MAQAARGGAQQAAGTITSNLLDAMPPNDLEHEQALLCSMIMRPDVIDDVGPLLTARDFYDDLHGRLYGVLYEMHGSNQRIDVKLVTAELKKRKLWDAKGQSGLWNAALLADVLQSSPTAANAVFYAQRIRATAVRRELIRAGTDMVRLGHDDSKDETQVLGEAESNILSIRDARASVSDEPKPIGELLLECMASLDARGATHGGLKTGFTDIDRHCGLRGSELTILAARPGMGKSALAMNMAINVAVNEGRTVLFVSLEMSALSLTDRVLSGWSGVPHEHMREGRLNHGERLKLIQAAGELTGAPLLIEVPANPRVRDIASVCRRTKRQSGLALLVVDYLQLVQADFARDSREQQVSKISGQLKQLARELDIPVLCLSQLNRVVEGSSDKRPKLSHLRESGAIEQDADAVWFVHREAVYMATKELDENPDKRGEADLYIAKNRNGQVRDIKLTFDSACVRFTNAAGPRLIEQRSNYDPSFDKFNNRSADELEASLDDGDALTAEQAIIRTQQDLLLGGEGKYAG